VCEQRDHSLAQATAGEALEHRHRRPVFIDGRMKLARAILLVR